MGGLPVLERRLARHNEKDLKALLDEVYGFHLLPNRLKAGKEAKADIEQLSRSWDWHVRRKAAWCPDAPAAVLETLPGSKPVREAVAGNERTPAAAWPGWLRTAPDMYGRLWP